MTNYVSGTEPSQNPAQNPQETTEQANAGISGTTHSRKRTDPAVARERLKKLKGSLKD